jgi:HTH-type transcriptional regulator / antitoxin HigA
MKVIKTEREYEAALEEVETLMASDPKPGTKKGDLLELLTLLISNYENEYYPLELPDPIEAIKFRMEQEGLSQRDLIPYIGSRSKVSEVLNGKIPLSLKMIRSVNKGLGIPAEVLLQDPGAILEKDISWERYPVKEIFIRKWFKTSFGSWKEAKDSAEELIQDFIRICNLPKDHAALFRKKPRIRGSAKTDLYALSAWQMRVWFLANQIRLPKGVQYQGIDSNFIQEVAELSRLRNGPKLAQEFLLDNGIILIKLEHLPKTYLDGAAMKRKDGTPVVALSIRHDRLDNFWFTLCHELAHIILHLDKDETDLWYIDDLDLSGDKKESDADKMAQLALIPDKNWKRRIRSASTQEVINYSKSIKRHPSIVAGRIRKEQNDYRILSRLVGNKEVKKLFIE